MNFKIFFKDTSVLTVNDKIRTFIKGKSYGFVDINKKEFKAIRKEALKNSNLQFTLTDNFTGCLDVIYGSKNANDKTVNNLIALNKSKKNKKSDILVKETKDESGENGLTFSDENNIIESGDDNNE